MRRGDNSGVWAAAIPVILAVAACGSLTESRLDARLCNQTYEFGNSGCAEVSGTVLGSADQPLPGIIVGPRYLASSSAVFNSPYVTTDSKGQFLFRITRFAGSPPATGPDTTSLFVYAVDPSSAGRDSVLAQVTVAPIGAEPKPATVIIRLAKP